MVRNSKLNLFDADNNKPTAVDQPAILIPNRTILTSQEQKYYESKTYEHRKGYNKQP